MRRLSQPLPPISRQVRRALLAVPACALLGACAMLAPEAPPSHLVDRPGIDIVSSAGGRQLVYLKDRDVRERFCYGPGVDLAMTQSAASELAVPVPHGQTGVGRSAGTGAMDLGGRSPAVLITREILYRACELALNIEADSRTTLAIYERLLGSLERIIASQQGPGGASSSVAPSAPLPTLPSTPGPAPASSSSGSLWGDSSNAPSWNTTPTPTPTPTPTNK